MTEKIIDEVMGLVDEFAADCIAAGIAKMAGSESAREQIAGDVRKNHTAIRAKLREVLERKPLNINVVHSLIPNLGERDAWDIEDMYTLARSVEKQHDIRS